MRARRASGPKVGVIPARAMFKAGGATSRSGSHRPASRGASASPSTARWWRKGGWTSVIHVRRDVGLRRHQVIVLVAGGRVFECVGRRPVRHGDRRVHEPGIVDQVLAVIASSGPMFRTRRSSARDPKPVPKDWTDFGIRPLLDVGTRPRRPRPAVGLRNRRRAGRRAGLALLGRHDRRRRRGRSALNGGPSRRSRPPGSSTPRSRSSRPSTEPARPGDVPDGRDRVADVDQRPHEPLPPRPDARGPRAAAARARPRHRAGDAVGAGLPPGPLDHAAQRAARRGHRRPEAFGEWPYFVSIFGAPAPAATSRGVGRSTATTCASTPWCSTAGS